MKGNDRLYNLRQTGENKEIFKEKKRESFKVSCKHQDSEEKLICLLCDNDTMRDLRGRH